MQIMIEKNYHVTTSIFFILGFCCSLQSVSQSWYPVNPGQDTTFMWCTYKDTITGFTYIGGQFKSFAGISANNIIKWDGTQWLPVGDGFNGRVRNIGKYKGDIIASGAFDSSGTTRFTMPIAKLSGGIWVPIDTLTTVVAFISSKPEITDFVEFDNSLFIIGEFGHFGPFPGTDNFEFFAYWNDTVWRKGIWAGYVLNADLASMIVVYNNDLYVGTRGIDTCSTSTQLGFLGAGLRKYDPVCRTFDQVGANWPGDLDAMFVHDGFLYISYNGNIPGYGKVVSRYDGSGFSPVGDGFNDRVVDFEIFNGELIAAGRFTADGNNNIQFPSHIAAWNGTNWYPFPETCSLTGPVIIKSSIIDSTIFVSGHLGSCGSQYLGFLASYPDSITSLPETDLSIQNDAYKIFPNPTSNSVTISRNSNLPMNDLQVKLYDITSRLVKEIKLSNSSKQYEIDLQELENGLYLLYINETYQTPFAKIIIIRK
jgi:hypothetical protein